MNDHKKDLAVMSTRRLLARRRALAAGLGPVEEVLSGALAEQTRRCGKAGCRCAVGEPHGPYAYFAPRPQGPRPVEVRASRAGGGGASLPAARREGRGGAGRDLV